MQDEEYRNALRLKCQTDFLFLAHVLGYVRFLDRVHGPVSELVVQKDPSKSIEKQAGEKLRLHLDPRGTFKTIGTVVDAVQFIICFPNIAICILTATKPLAKAIVASIGHHFILPRGMKGTTFQILFPEFCIAPSDELVGEFTVPNRTEYRKEATVMAFSIETSISGWHFDVMMPDDPVDTQNSATAQGIAKVKNNWRINKKTLMPWGFISAKGTRYDPFDLWGDMLDKAKPGAAKVLVRGALTVKSGKRLEPGEFPAPHEVELLFPELLSYEFLKGEFEDDFSSFMSQYMNDSQGGKEVTFTRESLFKVSQPGENMPLSGEVFLAFRFPYLGKPNMKFAAGAAGVVENGRMFIVDAVRGKFKPSALAHKIVQMAKRHGAHNISIEETPGARYYEPAIQNYALTLGWALNITWREFQEDDGVRDQRVKGLEPLIASTRLQFNADMEVIDQVFKQFANYGMIEESELPDVISRIAEVLPKSIAPAEGTSEQDVNWELARQRDLYDRTHGIGNYAPAEPSTEEPYKPPTNLCGLPDVLGGLNG